MIRWSIIKAANNMKVIFFNIALLLILLTPLWADKDQKSKIVDYFSPENILKFADYLYDNGDYIRAAGEYQRYIYLADSEDNDSLYYKTIRALFSGGDYDHCLNLLSCFEDKYPNSEYFEQSTVCEAVINYRLENYKKTLELAEQTESLNPCLNRLVAGMSYLKLQQVAQAQKISCFDNSTDICDEYKESLIRLCDFTHEADNLSFKSSFKAGIFSALIPGSGKIYSGRTADGLYSLLLIGLTGWQAYDGFDRDGANSTKGWIFATIGTTFYLGNIYGSVLAVRIYNEQLYENYLQGLKIEINLP
jgi:TM2 domain-containing membrane protein YozV